jgi:O-antigen/teichoic acid export membrane protein
VTISRYQSSTVQLDVTTPSAGYLVLADTYFPGWTARYQAAGSTTSWTSVPVLPADEAFRAIELPAGHWTVEFRYQPLAFREGLVASSLSLGVLLLLAAGWLWGTLNRTLDLQTNAAQRIAKNAISPMLSTLSNKVLDFGFNIFTAVIIGPDGIGRFAEAVSLVLLAGTVQDYGLGSATIRDVARDRSLATRYFTNTLLLRLALAVASLPVLAPIVWLGHLVGAYDALTIWTLVFLVAGFFPGSIASAAASVLRAVERFEAPAFVEVAGNLLRILLGSVALLAGWNVVGLAVTSLIVNVFNAVALGWAARGVVQLRLGPLDRPLCGFLLRDSFSLMLNNLLNLVFFRVDTVLLTFLVRDTAIVGYYSVAYKFIDGLGFVSSYLTFAIFPTLSRLATAPGDLFRRVYLFAVRVLIVTALPIMAVMGILGTRIVTLFYPDFAPAGPALSILVLFLVFSYVNGVTQYALIARGQQRIITGAFVVGVTFNIVANLAAIPLLGINGAALITVLSELVLAVPFFRGLWPAITPFPALLLIVRPLLAALGATAVTVILRDANWLIVLPAAALTYAILLVVLRALTTTDWRHMRQLFAQRSFSEAQLP